MARRVDKSLKKSLEKRTGVFSGQVRAGMTLLELLLSLALTSVVMVVISMAIQLHLFTLDTRRADVEQALLARSVLRHMAADIRNAVWYEPLEMTSLVGTAATLDAGSVLGGDTAGNTTGDTTGKTTGNASGDTTGNTSGNTTGSTTGDTSNDADNDTSSLDMSSDMDLTTEASENTTDIAGTVTPAGVPGLYGNQYELSVDCSRLPRVDQYSGTAADSTTGAAASIPSDVKTVSYFLRTEGSATVNTPGQSDSSMGLVRREMDRAAASWASQEGSLDASQYPGEVLAKEVTYLEFRYYDGTTWYTEWDSDQMGGLPMAIEMTISIDPAFGQKEEEMDVRAASQLASGASDLNEQLYRLVVHLPIAQPLTTEDTSGTTDGTSEASGDSSGASGGSSAGGTQGGTGS